MELKESLDLFVERFFDNVLKMEKYNELISETFEHIRESHPELYAKFHTEIEEMLDCIYYEMVETVIANIRRKDNIKGIKWSYEDIKNIVESKKLREKYHDFECLEFWYLTNKMYALHANPARPTDFYIELAEDIIANDGFDTSKEIKDLFNGLKGGHNHD
jgi:hypothetical protein